MGDDDGPSRLSTALSLGVSALGLLMTIAFLEPETYTAAAGPLHVDAFYFAVFGFGFLLLFSLYELSPIGDT